MPKYYTSLDFIIFKLIGEIRKLEAIQENKTYMRGDLKQKKIIYKNCAFILTHLRINMKIICVYS